MALTTMNISDLITKVRYTLQDTQSNRWTDSEMFVYIDDAIRDIALRTMYLRIEEDISIVAGTEEYGLEHEMIKFYSIDTVQAYEVTNATKITITDATAEDITVVYYAYPPRIVEGVDTVLTLEEDMYDMVRYYVLSRCYEKEDSIELLQKAGYFRGIYLDYMNQNLTRWHGNLDVTLAKSDYFGTSTNANSIF